MTALIRVLLLAGFAGAAQPAQTKAKPAPKPAPKPAVRAAAKPAAKKSTPARRRRARVVPPNYADSPSGDRVGGEDLYTRRAALTALGGHNGSVVVVDPSSGRILTIVNQKLAFQSGFTPCSTIKMVTALAALSEGVIARTTPVRTSRMTMDLTTALAQSHLSNGYFGRLGSKVGFDRVSYYARQFGLGEKAGWDIPEERAGIFPENPPYGVSLMTSFGTGISQTPLELAAFLSAIANGGTLYYLQYPRSDAEIADFVPRVKRELPVLPWLEDLRIGMRAAVESGTARRANYDGNAAILGKTGTCTDFGQSAHLGWFGSYNEVGRKLVVVVLLTGGHSVNGPVAAGVAGQVYRNLAEQNLLAGIPPLTGLSCCR